MITRAHATHLVRRRIAAALAATAMLAAGLLIAVEQPATAAAPSLQRAAAAPAPATTTSTGGAKLTVNPASGLSPAGGVLSVTGSGFSTAAGLYVAICHADGKAPASLKDCLGGAIPNSNATTSWAHITADGTPPASGGPVVAKWGTGGAFSVNITVPASNPASDALDCSQVVCAVYTTPDSGNDKSQNLSVPLTYQAVVTPTSSPKSTVTTTTPTPSTTPSSSAPISTTVASTTRTPTTVKPKLVKSDPVAIGAVQQVLFGGFDKGETVLVTLYSAPRKLPAVTADQDGVVTVRFTIPADLPISAHLLQVVGQKSKVTGVASFEVIAAPVVSSVVSSASASTATSAPVSSAAVTSAVAPVAPSISPALSSSAPTSSVASPITPAPTSSSRPVWPWYVLGLIVLLWIAFAIWMLQRRRNRLAVEQREKERLLAEGAIAEQQRAADAIARANADAPTAYLGPLPADQAGGYTGFDPGEHGLLSGRDNPDNPGLLSGHGYRQGDGDLPTTYLPPGAGADASADQPPRYVPPSATPPAAPPAAPTDGGGPQTSSWRPEFDDDEGDGPPGGRHSF